MSDHGWDTRPATHRRTYLLAGAIAVVGLAGAGLWASTALLAEIERPAGFERITAPGEGTVTLAEGDVTVVYAEGAAQPPSAADVQVSGPDGTAVTIRPYGGDLRYDVPASADARRGDVGTAVATFTAPADGAYDVGSSTFTGTLAVGSDLAPGALRSVLLPALLGVASLVAGLVIAVRTAVRAASRTATRSATRTAARTATRRTEGA